MRGAPGGGYRGSVNSGVAVPRTYSYRGYGYGGHYGSGYSYGHGYPRYGYGYGYPRYAYGYGYSPYYYPYYSGFSVGFGFGWGGAFWGGYGYGSPYYGYPAYAYPSYAYPSYGYPVARPSVVYQGSTPAPAASEAAEFGTLSVRVIPADAVILVDGEAWDRPQGEDRFSIDLAGGPHQIEVRKEGFRPYIRTVDILGGRPFTLNVSLVPGGSGQIRSLTPGGSGQQRVSR